MPEKLRISKRLRAVVNRINADIIADIACEHAYISIGAVSEKKAAYSVACDINPASLEKARRNIYNYGLSDRIETRLAYGLEELKPSSADCVVIAGIGGKLMREILNRVPEKTKSFGAFILQPQSEPWLLRKALHELGYKITDEDLILDGGIYYPVIEAKTGTEAPYGESGYIFGEIPVSNKHPVLKAYIDSRLRKTEEIIKNLPNNKTVPELEKMKSIYKETLKCLR